MVIKNLRQLFFGFTENSFAKQHSTDPLSRSELLFYPFIPLLTVLRFHIFEVPVVFTPIVEEIHEVVVYVPLELHFKLCHDILFQC